MGCRGYGYFILGHFVMGHITRCTDKMSADKILGGQNASPNCKGGQNAVNFYGTLRAKCQSYQNTLYITLMVK